MANPQKEQGYVAIANEIVDKFCRYRLSGEEWLVLWVILRKTYGWNKKQDRISLSQFAVMTNLKRQNSLRALKKLASKKIIVVIKTDATMTNMYKFNKNFDCWTPLSKKITGASKKIRSGINIDNKGASKKIHTKDIKDTIQKTREIPPLLDAVKDYFKELNYPDQAEPFYDHFQSNGWKVGGKAPMKDWKAAARQWTRRDFGKKKISGDSIRPGTNMPEKWFK